MMFGLGKFAAVAATVIGIAAGSEMIRRGQGHRRHRGRGWSVQDAGCGTQCRGPRGYAEGSWPVHGLRSDRRRFRRTLPAGTVENLLKPENKAELTAILTYHVVPGKVMAADVVKLKEAKTVNGKMLHVKVNGSNVMINDAKVTSADIVASNGVIHVIDSVVLPQAA